MYTDGKTGRKEKEETIRENMSIKSWRRIENREKTSIEKDKNTEGERQIRMKKYFKNTREKRRKW